MFVLHSGVYKLKDLEGDDPLDTTFMSKYIKKSQFRQELFQTTIFQKSLLCCYGDDRDVAPVNA